MSELNLREADRLEVTVLVDNYTDVFLESNEVVKRGRMPARGGGVPAGRGGIPAGQARPRAAGSLLAEHGFSCLIRVCAGPEEHLLLMDSGISPTCFLNNADVLGVDLSEVESAVLSHGHFDHFGGLIGFLGRARRGMVLTLHPDAFLEFRTNNPAMGRAMEMPRLDEKALVEAGAVLSKVKGASTLASELVMVTGDVERVTSFEKGFPAIEAKIDGEWVVDPFHHDQALAVKVKGKGLVVIGGCSHAGIINTVKHA